MTAVRAFEAAARHQNFRRAAEELGMTPAAVSQQVKALEVETRRQLFIRRARDVVLTPAGKQLATQVTGAFTQLLNAFDELRGEEVVLSLAVIPSFAAAWLVPKLGLFQSAHPDIAVRLDASDPTVDRQGIDYDAAIWPGNGNWPGMHAEKLFGMEFTPMCSPDFLVKHGPFDVPEDILPLLLVDRYSPWWIIWFKAAGIEVRIPEGPKLQLGAQNLEHIAASQGHGIALLTPALFKKELESGQLIRIFDTLATDERGYWFVYPQENKQSKEVLAFKNWILSQVLL